MIMYLLAAEYITVDGLKGEKLIFQHPLSKANPKTRNTVDEEAVYKSTMHEAASRAVREKVNAEGPTPRTNVLHWRNVCYDIQIKSEHRRILDGVSGWVKPGTLTALMVSCARSSTSPCLSG